MKAVLLALSLLASASGLANAQGATNQPERQSREVEVRINGKQIDPRDGRPVILDGRVLLPLRAVLGTLPAVALVWDPADQTVSGAFLDRTVRLKIGSRGAKVNGRAIEMDVPAQTVNGRTMVPLRFVGEALGAVVGWNDADMRVTVTVPSLHVPGSVAIVPITPSRRFYRGQQPPNVSSPNQVDRRNSLSNRPSSSVVIPAEPPLTDEELLAAIEQNIRADYDQWAQDRALWMADRFVFANWSSLQLMFNSLTFINGSFRYNGQPSMGLIPLNPQGWAQWEAVMRGHQLRDLENRGRLDSDYAAYRQVFRRVNPNGTPLPKPLPP